MCTFVQTNIQRIFSCKNVSRVRREGSKCAKNIKNEFFACVKSEMRDTIDTCVNETVHFEMVNYGDECNRKDVRRWNAERLLVMSFYSNIYF